MMPLRLQPTGSIAELCKIAWSDRIDRILVSQNVQWESLQAVDAVATRSHHQHLVCVADDRTKHMQRILAIGGGGFMMEVLYRPLIHTSVN